MKKEDILNFLWDLGKNKHLELDTRWGNGIAYGGEFTVCYPTKSFCGKLIVRIRGRDLNYDLYIRNRLIDSLPVPMDVNKKLLLKYVFRAMRHEYNKYLEGKRLVKRMRR